MKGMEPSNPLIPRMFMTFWLAGDPPLSFHPAQDGVVEGDRLPHLAQGRVKKHPRRAPQDTEPVVELAEPPGRKPVADRGGPLLEGVGQQVLLDVAEPTRHRLEPRDLGDLAL